MARCKGQGRLVFTNLDVYEGGFWGSRIAGQDKITYAYIKPVVYKGYCNEPVQSEKGREFFFNSDICRGGFVKGLLHGIEGLELKYRGILFGDWAQGLRISERKDN